MKKYSRLLNKTEFYNLELVKSVLPLDFKTSSLVTGRQFSSFHANTL